MIAYRSDDVLVWEGDCIELMRSLPDACMDSVVTDPPYALEFMGKGWDKFTPLEFEAWCELWAAECLRVLKPGGHLLAFGGTRTFHRLAAGIEDAGFEIRDSIAWLYGSGFPKSLDVSKAIDKMAGAEREVVGTYTMPADSTAPGFAASGGGGYEGGFGAARSITAPATPDAQKWAGWGTALKPAFEPIVVARKPLVGTVAANVLAHGTGALNIDGTRIGHASEADRAESEAKNRHADFGSGPRDNHVYGSDNRDRGATGNYSGAAGRWPANVILDEDQAAALDEQSGTLHTQKPTAPSTMKASHFGGGRPSSRQNHRDDGDQTGASRFFYVAKAPAKERPKVEGSSAHPTVKPLTLMQWLIRLVTPPGGVILDPFAGSGTTVEAALREGVRCMAMEREADYLPLIMHRIERHQAKES